MKHFFRIFNKTVIILLSSLLLFPFLLPFDSFPAEPAKGRIKQDVPASEEEPEQETQGAEASQAKKTTCLFIGNSKTYYNNLPEMYENIVLAGTGEEISCSSLTYGCRSEFAHGRAIRAVVRTKGDAEQLTDREKRFFTLGGVKDSEEFCEDVYQKYADVLLDRDGNVRTFDYIIIQLFSPRFRYRKRKAGVYRILRSLSGPDTHVVLSLPMRKFYSKSTLFDVAASQQRKDMMTERLLKDVRESGLCGSADIAYTGRASTNYLLYQGPDYAQNKSGQDYKIYHRKDRKKVRNDLVVGDSNHPTQLGTYLYACTIYSAIYGRNAADTVSEYRAQTSASICNLRFMMKAYRENYAKANGAFHSEEVLQKTAEIAFQTQCEDLLLPLEKPVLQKPVVEQDGVKLSWNKTEGASSYRIYRRTKRGKWVILANTRKTSYLDATAEENKAYCYAVACVAKGGRSIASNYKQNRKWVRLPKAPKRKRAESLNAGEMIPREKTEPGIVWMTTETD